MLNVLLESRRTRERRRAGTAASVAVHAAIIAAVVVGTARGSVPTHGEAPKVIEIRMLPVPAERPSAPRARADVAVRSGPPLPAVAAMAPPRLDLSRLPVGLPDGPLVVIRDGDPGPARGTATRLGGDPYAVSSGVPDGAVLTEAIVERPARVLAAPTPRYPERLRAMGIGGRVVVRFVIDTTGRVEAEGVQVMASSHADFEAAVLAVLPRLRFRPAEWRGKQVRMQAVMPFEFEMR
jgi:protein TonB